MRGSLVQNTSGEEEEQDEEEEGMAAGISRFTDRQWHSSRGGYGFAICAALL